MPPFSQGSLLASAYDEGLTFARLFWYFFFFVLTPLSGLCGMVVSGYNTLQRLAQLVREARSNILVSLKKRQQLANQLIDIVQGYAGHERLMHLKVSQDAAEASLAAAYQQTNLALAQVGALAEKFPELKADGTFRQLMADLQVIEGDLQGKRERYNACCREFNSRRNSIPTVLYATRFGFSEAPYLDFDAAAELDQVKDFASDNGEAIQKMLNGVSQGALTRSREIGARLGQTGGNLLEKGRQFVNERAAGFAENPRPGQENPDRHFWYLDQGNVRRGPVRQDNLADLLAANALGADSLVCAEGEEQWMRCADAIPKPLSEAPVNSSAPSMTPAGPVSEVPGPATSV